MEIRARYTTIGLFTLAVIAAGFAFVYWLNSAGGLGARSKYALTYDGPVAGLLTGSAVLFNGIRVGEVTGLHLDPAKPSQVLVDISVEARTPVRQDTHVGIDFQGLTGAPVVALSGGTPTLPLLASDPSRPIPILTAEKDAGVGMTQAARDVLKRIDTVVTDNAQPLHDLIANIDKFAGALARNTDRVDGIMAGLERLTGGGAKAQPRIFELAAAKTFPGLKKVPSVQLMIPDPTALSALDNEKIMFHRADNGEPPALGNVQWPDTLTRSIQARIVQSFENAHYMKVLGRAPPDNARGEFQLLIDVRSFQAQIAQQSVADVDLAAKIVSAEGKIVEARTFHATMPIATVDPETAARALSDAFEKVAAEIVVWTCSTI